MEEILRFVEERYSFEKIRLNVASFNQRAIKVYERAGFVKTGTARMFTNGGLYDFTQMEMRLRQTARLRRCAGADCNEAVHLTEAISAEALSPDGSTAQTV